MTALAAAAALLLHDERLNLSYFWASVLTALTPLVVLGAIGVLFYFGYRRRQRGGEGGRGKEEGKLPNDWRYRG